MTPRELWSSIPHFRVSTEIDSSGIPTFRASTEIDCSGFARFGDTTARPWSGITHFGDTTARPWSGFAHFGDTIARPWNELAYFRDTTARPWNGIPHFEDTTIRLGLDGRTLEHPPFARNAPMRVCLSGANWKFSVEFPIYLMPKLTPIFARSYSKAIKVTYHDAISFTTHQHRCDR